MKNSLIVAIIISAILAGGAGFYGGIQYQKSKRTSFTPGQFQNSSTRPNGTPTRNASRGNRPVSGEIVSIEDNTITIKTQDGSSKIVIYSDSTKVNKTSAGSKEDLKVGEQAMVIGTEGSDGTVTAQTISVGGNTFQGMPYGQPPNQNN